MSYLVSGRTTLGPRGRGLGMTTDEAVSTISSEGAAAQSEPVSYGKIALLVGAGYLAYKILGGRP